MKTSQIILVILSQCTTVLLAGPPGPQQLRIDIRGETLALLHYPAANGPQAQDPKVLLVSGDGGWRSFDGIMAVTMATWGYDVFGMNSRAYLKAFSHGPALTGAEVTADIRAAADFIAPAAGERVLLMGWSEGAALMVLVGASDKDKEKYEGVVAVSLPESGILRWHWTNNLAFLPLIGERGPSFSTVPYVPEVSPLPLVIIQSSHDKYVPEKDTEKLFAVAIRPRRRIFLHAGGHSFPGGRKEFFNELRRGLAWMENLHGGRCFHGQHPQ